LVSVLICVDTFSKYASVVLLPRVLKKTENIAAGLLEALKEMGCYDKDKEGHLLKTIYSDSEGGLVSKEMHNCLRKVVYGI